MSTAIYDRQSYFVYFDLGQPLELKVNIYIEDDTKLTREEMIAEAIGHAQSAGIDVAATDFDRIETDQLVLMRNSR